jgi:hypothetical protein
MDFPIYELQINEKQQDDAEVSFVALVDSPAIKRNFLAFNELVKFKVLSESDQVLVGPLMIPNQLIYRQSDKFGEHYVKFSAQTIESIAIKFAKKGYQNNVNEMHDPKKKVDGVTMFGAFITNSKWGVKPVEAFSDLPDGTWFGMYKIENAEIWNKVTTGEFQGFSVEGLFDYVEPTSNAEAMLAQLSAILNKVK